MSESFQPPQSTPPVRSGPPPIHAQSKSLARLQAERAAAMQRSTDVQRSTDMPAVHFVHEKHTTNGGFSMMLALLFLIGLALIGAGAYLILQAHILAGF